MDEYRHHVSGFFARREDAEIACAKLVEQGLPLIQLQIFDADTPPSASKALVVSNDTLKDVLVDSAIGAAVGTGIGALAEVALVAANVSLFVASPLIAPLVMMGWGISLGSLVGALVGSLPGAATAATAPQSSPERKDGWLADLITDAVANGQAVLVAGTRSEAETVIARLVMQASVGDYKDVKAA